MRVLITGAAGLIGQRLTRDLETEHEFVLGDVQPLDDPRWVQLDVTNPEQVHSAVQRVDAVIHLAIASGFEGDFEDDAFNQVRFDVNAKGTYNVAYAAAAAGVKRFVHTSSLTVVWGYDPPEFVAADAPPKPAGTYALTKTMGEQACRYVAETYGLSTVCLRISKPIPTDEPVWKTRKLRPQFIAFDDLLQAFRLSLSAENIGFEIVTLVGEDAGRRWDLSKAEQVLGYKPTCRLADMGYQIGSETEPLDYE
jgi:nucleoside-diphosphate-sugar epimerase